MPASRDVPVTGEPTVLQMFWNVASSVAAFVGYGMQGADKEVYAARLAVCDTCEQRSGNRCLKCGCLLSLKASGRIFECPLGKWPDSAANTQDSASGTPS